MARKLIVNADDFGMSSAVNEAVVRARREGVLTSASLMVFEQAAGEAVGIARDDVGLAVGLHLVVGMSSDPVRSGLALSFSRAARESARDSISRQFERFAGTGLALSHVDGHQHLHAHPAVLPFVIECAERYGASGIRVPCEPLWEGLRASRARTAAQLLCSIGQAYFRRSCRRCLSQSSLVVCDRCIGGLMTGRMSAEYVIRALSAIPDGVVEVYFHPSTEFVHSFGANPGDLRALVDPRLAAYLRDSGWELTDYAGLREVRTSERG